VYIVYLCRPQRPEYGSVPSQDGRLSYINYCALIVYFLYSDSLWFSILCSIKSSVQMFVFSQLSVSNIVQSLFDIIEHSDPGNVF
jgi:hypothetical protein